MFRYTRICSDIWNAEGHIFSVDDLLIIRLALKNAIFESEDVSAALNAIHNFGYEDLAEKISNIPYIQQCALIEKSMRK